MDHIFEAFNTIIRNLNFVLDGKGFLARNVMVKEEFREDQFGYSWYDGFEGQRLNQEIKPGTKRPRTSTNGKDKEEIKDLHEGKERPGLRNR